MTVANDDTADGRGRESTMRYEIEDGKKKRRRRVCGATRENKYDQKSENNEKNERQSIETKINEN